MVGLLIIVGIGLFVLVALLYVTRTDSNHEVFDGVEPHIGYRVTPSERSGITLPLATRSPADLVFPTELDADRALRRAMREAHREDADADEDAE